MRTISGKVLAVEGERKAALRLGLSESDLWSSGHDRFHRKRPHAMLRLRACECEDQAQAAMTARDSLAVTPPGTAVAGLFSTERVWSSPVEAAFHLPLILLTLAELAHSIRVTSEVSSHSSTGLGRVSGSGENLGERQ